MLDGDAFVVFAVALVTAAILWPVRGTRRRP